MSKKIEIFVYQLLTIFITLLPIALISGPFLSDLLISLSSIIFIFYCLYFKNFKYFNNNFFKFFIIFYLICLFSSLLSDFKLISTFKSVFYFRFGVFAVAFHFVLSKNKKLIRFLFFSLFFCFLILIIDGFFQYINNENILGFPKHEIRLSSLFGDELIYGSYLIRLLPMLIALFFLTKFSKKNYIVLLFFTFILLTFFAIFLSGERASFFLSILFLIYLMVMINKFSKYLFLFISILVFSISIISSYDDRIKTRMFSYTASQLGFDKESGSGISTIYKGHFLIAKDLFLSHKLFGVGPKNYRQHCYNDKKYSVPPYVCTTHPHNTYVQLLAETGSLGFLMIFSLFIIFSVNSAKHIYKKLFKKMEFYNFPKICIMGSILITLWPLTTSGSFFNNYINIFYFFPIGIFLYLADDTKNSYDLKI